MWVIEKHVPVRFEAQYSDVAKASFYKKIQVK